MFRKIKWQILVVRYNWCPGPVPGRGPAVEKHRVRFPYRITRSDWKFPGRRSLIWRSSRIWRHVDWCLYRNQQRTRRILHCSIARSHIGGFPTKKGLLFEIITKWKYFSIKLPPIYESSLLFGKVSRLHPFVLLIRATCEKDEYGVLVEWYCQEKTELRDTNLKVVSW
jgi:hypothetical protein